MSLPFNQTRHLKRVKELFNARVCKLDRKRTAHSILVLGSSSASHRPLPVTVRDGKRRGLVRRPP